MATIRLAETRAAVATLTRGRLGRYSGGGPSTTDRLERELESYVGVRHALAVNSGTSALVCALVGLGVGPGDEVAVPAYTWVSDAAAVVSVGAVPVLVEVDESLTIDPDDLEKKVTPRSRAVIAVHMSNLVCNMEGVLAVAAKHDLRVVEDACQAIGVTYRGRQVGGLGDVGTYSFNQHKNLRSGEGGAVLTNDEHVFRRALMYHDVGSYIRDGHQDAEPPFVGLNLRMNELSSAILRPQLRGLDRQMRRRRDRRAAVLAELSRRSDVRVAPHHDQAAAVGLNVVFDDPEAAIRFSQQPGVGRLIETGRHVYTNWEPILGRRTHDARLNPWQHSAVRYDENCCPRTLEILARSCSISLNPDVPTLLLRARARSLARSGRGSSGP